MDGATRARRTEDWSWVAPLVCAVHCLLAPALILAVPGFAMLERAEPLLMAVAALPATAALRSGWRVHGCAGPSWVAGAGMALWLLSRVVLPAEWLLAGAGALLVFGALVRNSALRTRCCECPACSAE